MKFRIMNEHMEAVSRTPCGVRGLKSAPARPPALPPESHPVRGAWIEMLDASDYEKGVQSHPVRGAWIEICATWRENEPKAVAPRAGCVD